MFNLENLENRELLSVLFADDFNDNSINPSDWTYGGNTVSESGQIMRVETTVTDRGGSLQCRWITINGNAPIEITRRVQLHYANQFSDPGFSVVTYADNAPVTSFGLQKKEKVSGTNGTVVVEGARSLGWGWSGGFCIFRPVEVGIELLAVLGYL